MELREGYKQTDLGLIPEDWNLVPFDSIFSFYSTSNYSKAQMSEDNEVGCIHYGLIHAITNTKYDLKHGIKYYVTSEQAKYELVRDGDVIMVDASEDLEGINKSVEVFGIGNNKYISGLHTFLLRDKKSLLADNFRGIILNSQSVKNQMLQLAVGMKVFGVSKTQLINVKLPLPPLPEQKAIAQVLSDTDNLIHAIEQKLTKKRAIKQGAMQQLLTPKVDWEVRKLPELCWFQEGPGLRNWQFTKKGLKVINVTNLVNGYLNLDKTDRHISMNEFEKMYKHFEIDENDIVMASSGNSYSKVAVVRKQDLRLLMNTSVIRFKPLDGLDYNYLLIFLKSKIFKDQIDLLITGGAQPNFGPFHLKKIDIAIPSTMEEQIHISTVLSDMEIEIEQIEEQLSKYKLLKQGLMQNLLTGKIRLV